MFFELVIKSFQDQILLLNKLTVFQNIGAEGHEQLFYLIIHLLILPFLAKGFKLYLLMIISKIRTRNSYISYILFIPFFLFNTDCF
jgi:hypothetical protein